MKTNTVERNVSISASESSVFTISDNAKIFRILIDGLYADKIQSITREIWSNALDAHVQAGCADRPFSVSFPNAFDRTFRVRDYGVSLTHDQVMHMYTALGYSTKEDTNDAIGKFGIGSKSPFAYTDNFTVTVYLDGSARFYSALLGKDGVPAIHLMGEQSTEEENGVEVAFPVEIADTSAFQQAAFRISHGFDVKPIIVNDNSVNWPTLPVLLEGDGWKLLHGAITGYSEKAYARMGPVLYPINANALGDTTQEQRQFLGHTFVIDFAMGELEITASREELSYGRNDPTTASILKRIDEIIAGLLDKCLQEIESCPTYFEACVKFREQASSGQIPSAVRTLLRLKGQWRGQQLRESFEYFPGIGWDVTVIEKSKLRNAVYKFSGCSKFSIPASSGVVVMVEDLTEGPLLKSHKRVQNYALENRANIDKLVWVRVQNAQRRMHQLIDFFGDIDGATIVMVNDLPEPPKPVRYGSTTRRPVQARVIGSGDFDEHVSMDAEDFEAGGVYVPLERMTPVVPMGYANPSTIVRCLRACGVSLPVVYGAPKSMIKKFSGDQWVSLFDYARAWFDAQDYDFVEKESIRAAKETVEQCREMRFLTDFCTVDATGKDSAVRAAVDLYARARAVDVPSTYNMRSLASAVDVLVPHVTMEHELADSMGLLHEELTEKYPLLSTLAYANVDHDDNIIDKVTDYVNMCDNAVIKNHHQAAIAA